MAAADPSQSAELELDSTSRQQADDYYQNEDPDRPDGQAMGSATRDKERKIGHRRVDKAGIVSYKKKPTSELMAAIQLGIGQSVGGLSSKPERDVLMQDFGVVEVVFFPGEGSNLTPAHHYSDFRFKTYAPVAFRYFRDLFGIQPEDFMLSLCNEPLKELSNPGASGSIFYITHDDEFIIKTVQHKEAEFLQKLLPGYFLNISQNKRTLLPKFYGLYCYQCGGKNIRFTVMNNLLPSTVQLHEKYDMKGSTYKRKASKSERAKKSPTLKDLDFMEIHPECLQLEKDICDSLIKTLQRDCRVLESFKIMDYSLLVGIYNLDQLKDRSSPMVSDHDPVLESSAGSGGLHRGKSMRTRIGQYSTPLESIQGNTDLDMDEDEDVPPGGIPARNVKGERLLLYLGIIDILQSFRLKKRLEHTVKSMVIDGDTISVHRPSYYAQRFLQYHATRVFKKVPTALKHSPSKRRALNKSSNKGYPPQGGVQTDLEHSTGSQTYHQRTGRTISFSDEHSAPSGGNPPDLLPEYSTVAGTSSHHGNKKSNNVNGNSSAQAKRSDAFTLSTYPSEDALSAGTASTASLRAVGVGPSYQPSARGPSPPLSLSESTPTHTDFTEGTPSFTNSSPSCSSDVMDMGGLSPLEAMDSPINSSRSPDLHHRRRGGHSGKTGYANISGRRSADDLTGSGHPQAGGSGELGPSPVHRPTLSPSKQQTGVHTDVTVMVIPESPPPPFEAVVRDMVSDVAASSSPKAIAPSSRHYHHSTTTTTTTQDAEMTTATTHRQITTTTTTNTNNSVEVMQESTSPKTIKTMSSAMNTADAVTSSSSSPSTPSSSTITAPTVEETISVETADQDEVTRF